MKKPSKAAKAPAPASAAESPIKHDHHVLRDMGGGASGAIAGAALGSLAGPVGLATGAVIGGVVGALIAKVADEESDRVSLHDAELDAVIGVSGGEMGAPGLKHPPAKRGTYSGASSGSAANTDAAPAEGPMQAPEE